MGHGAAVEDVEDGRDNCTLAGYDGKEGRQRQGIRRVEKYATDAHSRRLTVKRYASSTRRKLPRCDEHVALISSPA